MKGRIRKILEDKGYGYISPDGGGEDVYFRLSWLKGTFVRVGQEVEFQSERGQWL